MKLSINTLPCPFCGEDQALPRTIGSGHYAVKCDPCGAQGPDDMDMLSAAEGWNLRVAARPSKHATPKGQKKEGLISK